MVYLSLLFSFITSIILIPPLRNLAIKHRLYDEPTEDRLKIHKKSIPCLGGIGIFFGFAGGLVIARLFHQISGVQATGIILSSIIILFLGFWDDLKWKKIGQPLIKLFYQLVAGFLIVFILIKIGVNFHFSINLFLAASLCC